MSGVKFYRQDGFLQKRILWCEFAMPIAVQKALGNTDHFTYGGGYVADPCTLNRRASRVGSDSRRRTRCVSEPTGHRHNIGWCSSLRRSIGTWTVCSNSTMDYIPFNTTIGSGSGSGSATCPRSPATRRRSSPATTLSLITRDK